MGSSPDDVPRMLIQWSSGESDALEKLIPLVYAELRQIASRVLQRERRDHTIQPTALVHEAFLTALATFDRQQERIVELSLYGGLSSEETAEVIGISPATVKRDSSLAKAWLHREMENT
jgi:DNA-directed RNA polymerase specialized sigma24 family protein